MNKSSFIIIGPYPAGDFRHIGGSTILFRDFILYLKKNSFSFKLVNTLKYKGFGHPFLNFIYVIWRSLFLVTSCKMVLLNFNRRSLLYLGPVLFWYSKLLRVKVSLRMFGAFAKDELIGANWLIRNLVIPVLKNADLLFFETKREVEYFKNYNENTFWFPNCRNYPLRFKERAFKRKFVFISQLKIEKGVLQILEVIRDISPDYVIDLYGPVIDVELNYIKQLPNYKGIISFEDVYNVIDEYNVLLLPTNYPGEGYPGIIIESYAMSIPVITTNWNSIPEIVNDGESGLLIEPKSAEALKAAILKVDESLYSKLNVGAFEMSKSFQSEEIHKKIVAIIQNTIK